jgi:hypothetical protein
MIMEQWKDIINYEGRYQVSSIGRIKSLDRYVRHNYGGLKKVNGRILKPMKGNNGYVYVWLEGKRLTIHRLVAKAFLKDETGKYEVVEHINHDKTNNSIENLMWSTQSNNIKRNVIDGRWNNQYTKR